MSGVQSPNEAPGRSAKVAKSTSTVHKSIIIHMVVLCHILGIVCIFGDSHCRVLYRLE